MWAEEHGDVICVHPIKAVRLFRPCGWAREVIILLCMQAFDGHIDMYWERRPWFWPFSERCWSAAEQKVPDVHSQRQRVCRQLRAGRRRHRDEHVSRDLVRHSRHGALHGWLRYRRFSGKAWSITVTASLAIGTCTSAMDRWYPQILEVNRSLTITALAERAMSSIPSAKQTNWNDSAIVVKDTQPVA